MKSFLSICCLLLVIVVVVNLLLRYSNERTIPGSLSEEKIISDLIRDTPLADFISTTTTLNFGTEQGSRYYDEVDFRYHSASTGWYSFREEQRGLDCAMLLGGSAEFFMTVLEPDDGVLLLKGCAPLVEGEGEGRGGSREREAADLRLYLNDKPIGEQKLPRGLDVELLRFSIAARDLIAGDNRFRIEVDDGIPFNLPDLPFPVTLSAVFASATLEPYTRPTPSKPLIEPGSGEGKPPCLVHASGTRLEYFVLPREGERLRGAVTVKGGPLKAAITVTPHEESAAPLFSRILTKEVGRLEVDIDLSPFADRPCCIRLVSGHPGTARAGSYLRWESLRIVGTRTGAVTRPDGSGSRATDARTTEAGTTDAAHQNAGSSSERTTDSRSSGSHVNVRPDMIVVLLDAASSFFFESLGGRADVTPRVDAFANDAVLFPHAVTPAPYTLPAVGSIMTGEVPDRHGVVWNANREGMNMKLSSKTATAASLLKAAGYATFAVVTNPNAAGMYGYSKGFDRYEELFADPDLWHEGVAPAPAVDRAKELIRAHGRQSDGPFYLYLHLFQPHAPYTPPEEFVSQFADPDYEGVVDGRRPVIDGFKDKGEPRLTKEDFDQLRNLYAANLAYVDRAAGNFFDWLRAEGIFDDALVVVCSDHGEAFGEHRSIEHGHHLYEEALRVPLMIKFPGSKDAGRKVEETVCLTDLSHTLVRAAGADDAALGPDGIDLAARLDDRATWPDRALSSRSDVYKPALSLRWRGYQFIYDTLNRRSELYFLPDDPKQQHNVVCTQKTIAGYLRTRLCRYFLALGGEERGERLKIDEGFINAIQQIGYTAGASGKNNAGSGALLLPMGMR